VELSRDGPFIPQPMAERSIFDYSVFSPRPSRLAILRKIVCDAQRASIRRQAKEIQELKRLLHEHCADRPLPLGFRRVIRLVADALEAGRSIALAEDWSRPGDFNQDVLTGIDIRFGDRTEKA